MEPLRGGERHVPVVHVFFLLHPTSSSTAKFERVSKRCSLSNDKELSTSVTNANLKGRQGVVARSPLRRFALANCKKRDLIRPWLSVLLDKICKGSSRSMVSSEVR